MKKLLFAVIATIALGIAISANAQVFVGADPGGAGVRVGPFGVGVGPDYWGGPRYYRDYAYVRVSFRAHAHRDPKREHNLANA